MKKFEITFTDSASILVLEALGKSIDEEGFIINSITKDDLDGREVCDVLGCFHSWRCMYSYILRNYSSQQLDDKTRYMQYLYKVLNLVKMPLIQPADKKTIMKKYSGDTGISPEEYLKEN